MVEFLIGPVTVQLLSSCKLLCLNFASLQGPVAVKVQVPNMQDKTEWKLNGQVLNFTVPLTDQVCKCRLVVSFVLVSLSKCTYYNFMDV